MPKINVYLPDDLAEAVKKAGLPVSAICQRALDHAVGEVNSAAVKRGAKVGFERLTERARKVMRLADAYASEAGATATSPFVLLGLIQEGEGVAARALASLGVTSERVQEQLDELEPAAAPDVDLGTLAMREALKLGHNYIGTEHILLALVDGSRAEQLLAALDVTRGAVRREVMAILTGLTAAKADAAKTAAVPDGTAAVLTEILERLTALEKRLPG